jgi:rRNA maturation protein Rpf1
MVTVLPGSQRFNRGSMNQAELVAQIRARDAKAALVVSMHRGNPGEIRLILQDGTCTMSAHLESATLRREVTPRGPRVRGLHAVLIQSESLTPARRLAQTMASLLDSPLVECASPPDPEPSASGKVSLWFASDESSKTLWTHFHAMDGTEIGPRIRITSVEYERLQ